MNIRRANIRDDPSILHCLREAFAEYRDLYTPDAFADTVLDADSLARRYEAMSILVAVSELTGEIIGTLAYEVCADAKGHLRGMAVLPSWHGADVAQALLDRSEADLQRLGCSVVTLDTTEPLTRAIRFYERNGYQNTGIDSDFFGMKLMTFKKTLTGLSAHHD